MAPQTHEVNQDELEAPAWLNEEYFTKVLRHSEQNEDIEVRSLKLSPASAKGDHYASVMFRAAVDYQLQGQPKTKSMILKTLPEAECNKKEMFEDSHIFETEIGMYTEVLPKFEAILKAAGDSTVLSARCLYHSLSPRKVIIFEDLVPLGYTVLRGRELNLEEAKCAYSKIAKLHAASYKLNLEQPELFDKYRHGLFSIKNLVNSDSFRDGIVNFTEMLSQHEDLIQYKPYFEHLKATLIDNCQASFEEYRRQPKSSALYVLCHGDFHYKNLMFKSDQQTAELEDIMLLDYQMCYVGPIANDIIYSMYMQLNTEQRAKHLDELLHFYFTTFQQTLKKIGFKDTIPTMLEFRQQLIQHKHFELFLMTTFLPMWSAFANAQIDAEELLTSANTRQLLYEKKPFLDEVRKLLPKYLHMGYLEE